MFKPNLTNKFTFIHILAASFLILTSFLIISVNPGEQKICETGDRNQKVQCFTKYLEELMSDGMVETAFSVFENYKSKDQFFSSDCHVYAHVVGELSYWRYIKGEFKPTDSTMICDAGFYHGFMQEMGHHNKEFYDKAPAVCEDLTTNFSGQDRQKALNQCFHGIGHGITFANVDLGVDAATITKKGIEYCRKILPAGGERLLDCVYGIYGGISSLYYGMHGYKWPMDPDKPFILCESEPTEYQKGCYVALVPALFSNLNTDFQKGFLLISEINNPDYAREATLYSGYVVSHNLVTGEITNEEIINICQGIPRNLSAYCIQAVASGIYHYSLEGDSVKKANQFCESDKLTVMEKSYCFKGIKERIRVAEENI